MRSLSGPKVGSVRTGDLMEVVGSGGFTRLFLTEYRYFSAVLADNFESYDDQVVILLKAWEEEMYEVYMAARIKAVESRNYAA